MVGAPNADAELNQRSRDRQTGPILSAFFFAGHAVTRKKWSLDEVFGRRMARGNADSENRQLIRRSVRVNPWRGPRMSVDRTFAKREGRFARAVDHWNSCG